MAGNRAGGLKARDKNLAKDPDFYRKMGQRGGSRRVPKGFGVNAELASRAGRLGGLKSRKQKAAPRSEPEAEIHHPWRKTLFTAIRGRR